MTIENKQAIDPVATIDTNNIEDYIGSEYQQYIHSAHFEGIWAGLRDEAQRFEKFSQVARHNVNGHSLSELPSPRYIGRNLLYLAWQHDKEELRELHSRIQSNMDALAVHEGEPVVVANADYLAVDSDVDTGQSSYFYGAGLGENSLEIKTIRVAKQGVLSELYCVYGGLSAKITGNYYLGSDVVGYRKIGLNTRKRNVRLDSVTAIAHASIVDQGYPLHDPVGYHKDFRAHFHHSRVLFGKDAKEFVESK